MHIDPETKIYKDIDIIYKKFSPNNRENKKLVFVNGTFDLFHAGHAALLNEAARLGDFLLVFVNTDESIKALKGPERPILPLKFRQYLLASLASVDAVYPFSELRVTHHLEVIRPDVWAKASDYTMESIETNEKRVADLLGINIKILPKVEGLSSTELINRIKDSSNL